MNKWCIMSCVVVSDDSLSRERVREELKVQDERMKEEKVTE